MPPSMASFKDPQKSAVPLREGIEHVEVKEMKVIYTLQLISKGEEDVE